MSEAKRFNPLDYLERTLPKLVIAPSFMAMMVFIYGFILWTVYISMSKSTFLPNYDFVGLIQYVKLWRIDRWSRAFGPHTVALFHWLVTVVMNTFQSAKRVCRISSMWAFIASA